MAGENEQLLNQDTELSDAVREQELQILDEAFNPPEEEKAEAKEVPDEGDKAPARDEQGRFAAKSEPKDEEAEPQAEQKAADEAAGKDGKEDGDSVPRWRLREIAEERRQAQAEAQTLRAELARLQVQQQRPQQQEQQQQPLDPLIDPQGFVNQMRSEFQAELRREALNNNLAIAHMRHGETFEKAYGELLKEGQNGNRQLVQQLTAQGNPGEAIVSWFKHSQLIRETGGDIGKFKENVREELLKDPEFRKAVIEAIKGEANGGSPPVQQQNGVRNITRLPPSLSRAAGGSPNTDPIDTDDSDASVFAHAFK